MGETERGPVGRAWHCLSGYPALRNAGPSGTFPLVSLLPPTCLHASRWPLCRNTTWEYRPPGPPSNCHSAHQDTLPGPRLPALTYVCLQAPEMHCPRRPRPPESTTTWRERHGPGLPRGPPSKDSQHSSLKRREAHPAGVGLPAAGSVCSK